MLRYLNGLPATSLCVSFRFSVHNETDPDRSVISDPMVNLTFDPSSGFMQHLTTEGGMTYITVMIMNVKPKPLELKAQVGDGEILIIDNIEMKNDYCPEQGECWLMVFFCNTSPSSLQGLLARV